mmetsp:Transcript_11659/g.22053  ORF Transcript_11659/g.22053 Transcript_11659/m.22053 type:complete len:400 (-) Transcript_11659:4405-5604(-)
MAKTTPKNILITGSSGYVGQHLIASLALGGLKAVVDDDDDDEPQLYELFCAYNSLPTFENDLIQLIGEQQLHPSIFRITPIPNVDFSNPNYIQVIQNACSSQSGENNKKIDAIIHLAALSSPGYCEQNSHVSWKVNCPIGLLTLNAPIIYMSTDQVYEGTKQFYQEDNDYDETVPVNVYGRTKLAFERVLLRNATTESTPLLTEKELGGTTMPDIKLDTTSTVAAAPNSVILRSSLILGPPTPFQNGCRKGAFPSFLQFIESRILSSTPTNYFINEFRSVVHVEDVIRSIRHFVCQALLRSGENDVDVDVDVDDSTSVKKTRVFNLGGSTRASRYDVALEVAGRLKCDASSANGVDRPPTVPGGVRSPPDISMNVDKLTKELGLMKMDGLKEIVLSTFK